MEPTQRHPECPNVHLGACAKCRRLYERDRKNAEAKPEEGQAGIEAARSMEEVSTPEEGGGTKPGDSTRLNRAAPITHAEKNRERVRRFRANMTPEQRAEYRKKDRERKRRKRKEAR